MDDNDIKRMSRHSKMAPIGEVEDDDSKTKSNNVSFSKSKTIDRPGSSYSVSINDEDRFMSANEGLATFKAGDDHSNSFFEV